jgi:hypothetical protein
MKEYLLLLIFILLAACTIQVSGDNALTNKKVKAIKVCDLPPDVFEASGIVFHRGLLWTFNDSGHDPVLYAIDTVSGSIIHTVEIQGGRNTDWEAITQDSGFIYIADNGNNYQSRDSYVVYVIDKQGIGNLERQLILPSRIIEYKMHENDLEQIGLSKTLVDSEAILVEGDSIYFYTKELQFAKTNAFSLHAETGKRIATRLGSFNPGFAVTAATKMDEGVIAFLGYINYHSFLTIIESRPDLLGEPKVILEVELEELQGYQTEGITYENGVLFISCEEQGIPQALFRLSFY